MIMNYVVTIADVERVSYDGVTVVFDEWELAKSFIHKIMKDARNSDCISVKIEAKKEEW